MLNLNKAPVDIQALEKMTRCLRHRGPDFEGFYNRDFVGFGHTRLSIIDLSVAGNQPMASDDEKMWILYNGEVYNYKAIRNELTQKGYSFRSNTDTEVVLKSYQHWGTACLDKLNGMFAFAVWDEREKALFLARDRLGIKPLYYYHSDKTFAFASEVKALIEHDKIEREINFGALNSYLTFRYVPAPDTIFKRILKFPPAHYMLIRDGKISMTRYWDFEFDIDDTLSAEQWEEEFYELLKDSVSKRLMSDVPLGVYLSGGVDSTSITGLMHQLDHSPIKTFSIGFGTESDESHVARKVANTFQTSHKEFLVTPDDFSKLPEIIWHLDEPFGDIVILPVFLLSHCAKDSVKVVLTGEGGDELLGGYVHQKTLARLGRSRDLLSARGMKLLAGLVRLFPVKFLDFWLQYPASMGPKGKERLVRLLMCADDEVQSYLNFASVFTEEEKSNLLSPALKDSITASGEREWEDRLRRNVSGNDRNYFNRLIRQEFDSWLPDNILFKQDRLTMGNSIEGRVPFLDHRIVEFCARLPLRLKMRGTDKYLIRRTARRRIYNSPDNIKRPFFMPLTEAFEKPYQQLIDKYLLNGRSKPSGWWNDAAVRELVGNRKRSPFIYDKQIMILILWQMWAEVFKIEPLLSN
jgi:asparagine synthase (glutamine-hydrolysing)